MSAQPEALRLADELEDEHDPWPRLPAAAELRRLHAENEAFGLHLSERMKDLARVEAQRDALLEALKLARPYISTYTLDGYHAEVKADAAIKATEGEE